MIKIKPCVEMVGIRPQITVALTIAGSVYDTYNCDCVVTSFTDGKHMEGSKHYDGDAVDLRIRNVPEELWRELTAKLRLALGPNFDTVLEKDHIHVEYDPK